MARRLSGRTSSVQRQGSVIGRSMNSRLGGTRSGSAAASEPEALTATSDRPLKVRRLVCWTSLCLCCAVLPFGAGVCEVAERSDWQLQGRCKGTTTLTRSWTMEWRNEALEQLSKSQLQ